MRRRPGRAGGFTGPICKEARTILQVQAGYGLSVLGIDLVPEQVLRPAVEQMITSTEDPNGPCPQSGL